MKCSLGISNFLEENSSLSRSIVFCYFFALITEEGFLISPCYSLDLCIQMGISFLSPFPFASLLFSAICKASSDHHFAFLHLFFLGMVLITASCTMSQTSVHCSSGTLSDLIPWIYLSLPPYNHKGFDLAHIWMVCLEKEMATHSSILAWRIPWKEEPGGLQSPGSQRVGHDWATSLILNGLLYIFIYYLYDISNINNKIRLYGAVFSVYVGRSQLLHMRR